jgi:SOS response associated peptidase (SRAP)
MVCQPGSVYARRMCGRARLSSDVSEIKLVFGIPPERPTPNIAPSWNVAPTDPLPVVRYDAKDRQRSLEVMRWGPGAVLGQGHQGRLRQYQRQGRGDRKQARLPRSVPPAALPGAGRQFFRVAENRFRQAALRDRAERRRPVGAGGTMGDLPLAGRRTRAQLRDHHHRAERIVRPAA